MIDWTTVIRVATDAWIAERRGPDALLRRQFERLASLVSHARVYSPYYRDLYAGLPVGAPPLTDLPVTHKQELMGRFDDWVTDKRVTLDDLRAFIADPTLIGVRYLDEYFVCRSSGTTGFPGVFLTDRATMSLAYGSNALSGLRMLSRARWRRLITKGMREATVVGTGGHFAGVASIRMQHLDHPHRKQRERAFSVEQPLSGLVAQLNEFDPAILTAYPSALKQLTREQLAGRLRVQPALLATAGETISVEERLGIAEVFGAYVVDGYACSECILIAAVCSQEWLHYRNDWMILEPVDVHHQPLPPGQLSETVLLTNLTNRVQPFIRYDLGDSILMRPDPCECGSPLPAFKVAGRQDDVLRLASNGTTVEILPLAIASVIEGVDGLDRFQIIQDGPSAIAVRISCDDRDRGAVWDAASKSLGEFLGRNDLGSVVVRLEDRPPDGLGASGKFRQVIGATARQLAGQR